MTIPCVPCSIAADSVITPDRTLKNQVVRLEEGKIVGVMSAGTSPRPPDYAVPFLIPGLIDIHINGAGGGDAASGKQEDLARMSEILVRHGCTSFQPTIITDHKPELVESLQRLASVLDEDYAGARPFGIHLEGPFLNPEKRGVHRLECIQPPSIRDFDEYLEASAGRIGMLTLAPEMPGALELIHYAKDRIPVVSLGHTNASYRCAVDAAGAGAGLVSHLFNATTPVHHREPGLSAAAMVTKGLSVELIADGIHVHPEVVRILFRSKGPGEVILVTDAISAAGMPDGVYVLGNLEAHVKNGVCRDAEGRLAGSTLQMDVGLRLLYDWFVPCGELEFQEVVATATSQPAELLGLSGKGRIRPGFDADLVALDEDLNVLHTWVGGALAFDVRYG